MLKPPWPSGREGGFSAVLCLSLCWVLSWGLGLPGARAEEAQTVEEVFEFMGKTALELKSWSADMDMTMNVMGMKISTKGSIEALGSCQRSEMTVSGTGQDMRVKTVLDEQGIQWTETASMGRTQVMKVDMTVVLGASGNDTGLASALTQGMNSPLSQDPRKLLEGMGSISDLALKGTETIEGTKVYLLEGPIKEEAVKDLDPTGALAQAGTAPDRVLAAVGTSDGFVRKIQLITKDGQALMTVVFTNVDFDAELEQARFKYTPPQGAKVLDMTATVKARMNPPETKTAEDKEPKETPPD